MCCTLSQAGEKLYRALPSLTALTYLNLAQTGLGSEKLCSISGLRWLQELSLSQNPIQDFGNAYLLDWRAVHCIMP